uniref:TIL domain containing protein n=1 Tax=Rhipicephalus zambeziensis TaxID=60191 RepID=A0A224YHL6_9ACAR
MRGQETRSPWRSEPSHNAKKTEVFKTCQSGSCAETHCEQLLGNLPKLPGCTKDCVTGCFCRKGFYRHSNLKCVTAAACRKS